MAMHRIDGSPNLKDTYQNSKVLSKSLKEGIFKGEKLQVKQSATSQIADAAEELTFSVAETVEKKIEKRRVSKKRRPEQLKQIEKLSKMVPDVDKSDLLNWCKYVRKNPPKSAKELLKLLDDVFDDVTHKDLVLSMLKELLSEDKDRGLYAIVDSILNSLESKHEAEIKAGFNISSTAQTFSEKGLSATGELRKFYRSTILKYEGINQTFESIVENFPDKNFPDAIQFLIQAVGSDLHSRGPSIEPSELKQILDDLYNIESLGNLYRECDDLIQKTQKGFDIQLKSTTKNIVGQILRLKDSGWINTSEVMGMLHEFGIFDLEAQIYFLQNLKEKVRLMPLKLFSDDDSRYNILDKMQEAIDNLIESEEE